MAVENNRLHLIKGDHLNIVDVSNPSNPALLGTGASVGAWGLDVGGSVAFLASPSASMGGLHIVDLSNPNVPSVVARAYRGSGASGVAASGSLAVANGHGLQVIDVSDASEPAIVGVLEGLMSDVALRGSYAYASLNVPGNPAHTELIVVDLRVPTQPTVAAQIVLPIGDLQIVGSLLYVAMPAGELRIFDVSNPFGPQVRSSVTLPGSASKLRVKGSLAYVSNTTTTYLIDVQDPGNPSVVSSIPFGGSKMDVEGDTLYVVNGGTFRIVDISDSAAPVLLSNGESFGAWAIEVVGSRMFLATPNGGGEVIVCDVSDPTTPEVSQRILVPGGARSITADGNYVYVGDDAATIDIFHIGS